MPWEKQFDIDETLAKAMQIFWCQGFDATSMQDLVGGMGINPGSIYATFGNKRSLFIRALRHYEQVFIARFNTYGETLPPKAAILAVFESAVEDALENPDYCGCLLVNTALEVAPVDKEVALIVAQELESTQNFFHRMIEHGQLARSISKSIEAVYASQVLLTLLTGLRVLSRGRPERDLLLSVVKQAKEVLK